MITMADLMAMSASPVKPSAEKCDWPCTHIVLEHTFFENVGELQS